MSEQNSAPKFAFYYMLSLVSLIFLSISIGQIFFQIINKSIDDPIGTFGGNFSSGTLRFGISALIISAPVFFTLMRIIYKSLFDGKLNRDSEVRKWLTYFILFISSVVMIGWMIATLNNYLNGEITLKFALKALTSIAIASIIFSFFFYDIRRKDVVGAKDKVVSSYFYGSLVLVSVSLIAGFIFSDSPATVRAKKHDRLIIENFQQIENAINSFYTENKKLPENLSVLTDRESFKYFVSDQNIKDPQSGKAYEYRVLEKERFEICGEFQRTNKDEKDEIDKIYVDRWPHEAGRQCFTIRAQDLVTGEILPIKR